ncbi:glycogen synthase GlgA [sulfur-oxidizing endosymbiont of Gigantopelta aegis]|uniref:glycogen synthase GlgA n=1 Tax=sulfur-oxidizing endosymbiont of Gigantopelta aegis TaxID=2794934 RepID=UPI0018DD95C9|nr:glycogen synthase GlgA [sulfur-oxidizing endosymbiont of Gigantopelta aegis]
MKSNYKILFISSEVYPFAKTGGLGDVSNSLPKALKDLDQDIRILMPAYPFAIQKADSIQYVAKIDLPERGFPGHLGLSYQQHRSKEKNQQNSVAIIETTLPDSKVKVWMLESELYNRSGTPYSDEDNQEWPDNDFRFALLNYIAVEIAMGRTELNWQADIIHGNDWQAGLAAVLLAQETVAKRPASVFTIHNMSHMGVYSRKRFDQLELDPQLWNHHELEFYENFSFIKGGLIFSDRINTVSPSYAKEIQTEEFGYGLAGLLAHRKDRLSGILNGIDMQEWDPETDPMIEKNYSLKNIADKQANKLSLQKHFHLPVNKNVLLLGMVARLVYQKGVDLIIKDMEDILELPVQLVILGSGDEELEKQLTQWAKKYPEKIQIQLGYDEALSHQIEAGADAFLMSSRFEPCGLNQLYSLRYGTIPIVRETGGLADTVIHASNENLNNKTATGIVFHEDKGSTVLDAIKLTSLLYQSKTIWRKLTSNAMKQHFSWQESAEHYLSLYTQAIEDRDKIKTQKPMIK